LSGEIWPDNEGVHVNAHGGGVLYHDGTYYWYGEHKSEKTSSALVGVMCYSSKNLTDWKNEGPVLKVVDDETSDIVRGCVLERPKVIYNEKEDLSFLHFKEDYLNQIIDSKEFITEKFPYFYQEFSKPIVKFKFQDYDYLSEIIRKYGYKQDLVDKRSENKNYDFLLCFECEKIAIVVGGDFINCFNDFESLDDDEIKRVSNNWIFYYLDYWNKKGTDKEYAEDLLCEEFPLK
jgi:hypothetical protein